MNKITFDIQRMRNLTTGRLHTEMSHIYQDLESIMLAKGIMTHMIPRVMDAIKPWLLKHIHDKRFWDGKYDTTHVGQITIPEPTPDERFMMWSSFHNMPDPLANKEVIRVIV